MSSCRNSTVISFVSGKQEFNIEIPDAEADEIKTVQQGMFFTLYTFRWLPVLTFSRKRLTILPRPLRVSPLLFAVANLSYLTILSAH
jgi:hypothetical protein